MSEFDVRLAEIRSGPWNRRSELARSKIRELSTTQSSRLFRFHIPETVKDLDEIEFRNSFDEALDQLQLLELAVECGYLSLQSVKDTAAEDFRLLLTNPQARRYVEMYDFVPIRFLAARIGFDIGLTSPEPPPINPSAAVRFATFLSLHREMSRRDSIEMFLKVLDDFRFAGLINAPYLKDRLQSGNAFLETTEKETLLAITQGLIDFVQILGDLFLQLDADEQPLFGCFYGYWLSHFFGFRRTERGYELVATSFGDVSLPSVVTDSLSKEAVQAEEARFRHRIELLDDTWQRTRDFIESSI